MNKFDKFLIDCGYMNYIYAHPDADEMFDQESDIPCYLTRVTVRDEVNTHDRIADLIRFSAKYLDECGSNETILMFSVTERDECWKAWKDYALANPKKLSVVESRSKMGPYKVRMYFYVIPKKRARK